MSEVNASAAAEVAAKLAKKKSDLTGIGIPVTLSNAETVAAALAPLGENRRIKEGFAKPFAESEIKMKPQTIRNNRALVIHYVDARLVMDRLDDVVEPWGWRDEYTLLPGGEVECRLSVKFGDTWITKADVGGQSEQPDEGDRMKAAYSDALKRAAVKFGIGRHLYRMPNQWVDYDPVKKQIVKPGTRPTAPQPHGSIAYFEGRLKTVGARNELVAIYREFEADVKEGKIPDDAKRVIDGLFKVCGAMFPAPQPTKA